MLSIVGDSDEGSSWNTVANRVTSRLGDPFSPECLSLSISFWPEVGATNEIKTLPLFASLPEYMSEPSAFVKI